MKKTVLAVAAMVLLGFGAVQMADAGSGWHHRGGSMMGGPGYGACCDGPGGGWGGNIKVDPEKRDAFLKETESQRREMATLRGEYQALLARENPDPKQAGELHARMFDLRSQIHAKAAQAGIGGGYGMGPGYGHGPENCPNRN